MKILFYDIETSPTQAYVWKLWKENVSLPAVIKPGEILCWASAWEGSDELDFAASWDQGYEDMIRELHDRMTEADATVTYNGINFDGPIVNAAFAKLGLAPPPPSKAIDLYRVVKRNFRFLSHRLDFVCQELGLGAKSETGGFKLWTDVIDGDPEAQAKMMEYNCHDVELTEALYYRLLPWIKNHPNRTLYDPNVHAPETPLCPNCGSLDVIKQGKARTMLGIYQRYQCRDCGTWSRGRKADKAAAPVLTQDKTA